MDPLFVSSILALGGLGLLFGSGLAYASKKFSVEIDPKVEEITETLPGINCGACGYPGCSAYAEAVAAGKSEIDKCAPGGEEVILAISAIMGVEASDSGEKRIAVLHCQGGKAEAVEKFFYEGIEDCHAAELIGGGLKACSYGCLGLGSCERACPFDAIAMNDNGLPVVDEEKCTACGICVTTCPRNIFSLIPRSQKIFLGCVSQDKLKAVKAVCTVGCYACKLCALPKITPSGAIKMEGNLPVIVDTSSEELFAAVDKCPAKCYVVRMEGSESKIKVEEQTENR